MNEHPSFLRVFTVPLSAWNMDTLRHLQPHGEHAQPTGFTQETCGIRFVVSQHVKPAQFCRITDAESHCNIDTELPHSQECSGKLANRSPPIFRRPANSLSEFAVRIR